MATSRQMLRAQAATCARCELYRRATQTVVGEGTRRARVMLVGEQPGDREDLEGRPFVGPATRAGDGAPVDLAEVAALLQAGGEAARE